MKLRRRWLVAKMQREARESWYWHRSIYRRITWPIREPWSWWYCRRIMAAMKKGQMVVEA